MRTIRDAASKNKRGANRGRCAVQRPRVNGELLSNVEAERVVICACILYHPPGEGLGVEDFTEWETRLIYRALTRGGLRIYREDTERFLQNLEAWGEWKRPLWEWVWETLYDYYTPPGLVDWYIEKLKEARTRREMVAAAGKIERLAYEVWRPVDDVLRESKTLMLRTGNAEIVASKTKVPK